MNSFYMLALVVSLVSLVPYIISFRNFENAKHGLYVKTFRISSWMATVGFIVALGLLVIGFWTSPLGATVPPFVGSP